jgi:hypothetical protein
VVALVIVSLGVLRYAKKNHPELLKLRLTLDSYLEFYNDQNAIHHIRQSGQAELSYAEIYRRLDVKDPLKRNHYVVGRRIQYPKKFTIPRNFSNFSIFRRKLGLRLNSFSSLIFYVIETRF